MRGCRMDGARCRSNSAAKEATVAPAPPPVAPSRRAAGPQLPSARSSAVGAESSRRMRTRSTPAKADACANSVTFSSTGSGVLDHERRALPAPSRTATMLRHAERASAKSKMSCSDIPS